jgi:tetraacyldisaccharide 4'-kinase
MRLQTVAFKAEKLLKANSFPSFILKTFLFPFSLLWGLAVFWKNFLYDVGAFKSLKVSSQVISIGNITAGGTGKTPLVLYLVEELLKKGKSAAILTRGYRSRAEHKDLPVRACSKEGAIPSWEEIGDEPYLLAKKLPVPIFVGKNRVLSAKKAEEKFLVLDDGLQYRKLYRNFEIVAIDASSPLEEDMYLPCGRLRDSKARLKEASLIVLRPISKEQDALEWQKVLRKYTSAPIVGMEPIFHLRCPGCKLPNSLEGLPVAVFCGIAKPEGFLKAVCGLGVEIKDCYIAPDHEKVPVKEFSEKCAQKGIKFLICTEKDYVKIENETASLPIAYLQMDYQIRFGRGEWEKLIEKMLNN